MELMRDIRQASHRGTSTLRSLSCVEAKKVVSLKVEYRLARTGRVETGWARVGVFEQQVPCGVWEGHVVPRE